MPILGCDLNGADVHQLPAWRDAVVVIGDTGVLNNALRFEDEFVRHKILDIIGDIVLLGMPLKAHIIATRPGHAINAELTKLLFAKLEEKRGDLVGAIIVAEEDEVLVVLASGKVVRSAVSEVPAKGRDTMGVVFARFDEDDNIIGLAKNTERNLESSADGIEDAEGEEGETE